MGQMIEGLYRMAKKVKEDPYLDKMPIDPTIVTVPPELLELARKISTN